jgi:hypothetical protein
MVLGLEICHLSNERRRNTGAIQNTGNFSENIVQWAGFPYIVLTHLTLLDIMAV